MTVIALKPQPSENEVVQLSNGNKIQWRNGAWRIFASTTVGGGVQLPADIVRTADLQPIHAALNTKAVAADVTAALATKPSLFETNTLIANSIKAIDRLDLKFQATTGAMDLAVCQSYSLTNTVAGAKTLSFSNIPTGRSITVVLQVIGNVGSVVFPSSIAWPDGAPALVAGTAMFALYYNGTSWTGVQGPSA